MFTKHLIHCFAITLVSSITAQAFSDNFNRPDDGLSSAGTVIGPKWVNGDTDNFWAIIDEAAELVPTNAAGSANTTSVLYNTAYTHSTTDGSSTTIEADVIVSSAKTWGGIAFNIQNSTDFYQLRFKADTSDYQLVKVSESATVAGERSVSSLISRNNATATFDAGTAYHLSVTSTVVNGIENSISFDITPVEGGIPYNPTSTFTDRKSAYLGGFGGLSHANDGGTYRFDNFSIMADSSESAFFMSKMVVGAKSKRSSIYILDILIKFRIIPIMT